MTINKDCRFCKGLGVDSYTAAPCPVCFPEKEEPWELQMRLDIENEAALNERIKKLESIIENDQNQSFLIKIIADIRKITGLNEKPMLSDLPDAINNLLSELRNKIKSQDKQI